MKKPITPVNEEKRLAALYEYAILDTPAEEIFDLITSIASTVCQTPMGLITLIDENRQWFKSSLGLENTADVDRNIAFCSHTILQPHILEVTDATLDERFYDNPFVTGSPYIRFYAGHPLTDANGYQLGALCVIDKKPKELNENQKSVLKDLSGIIIKLFENKKEINLHLQNQKKIENELREHQIFNDQILNSALNGIVTFNERGLIHSVNPAITALFRYESQTLIGKNLKTLLPDFDYLTCEGKLYETRGLTSALKPLIIELFISQVEHDSQKMKVGFIRDLTQLKAVEKMKNEFIGIASHELRTPLTSIKGSLQLLLDGKIREDKKQSTTTLLEIAVKNCDRLIRLINNLLDIEKIESGNMSFNLERVELGSLVQEVVATNQAFSRQYAVSLVYECQLKEVHVQTDRDRLIQVITNLISNAIKFSPKNGVVSVQLTKEGRSARVNVHDQGVGISAEFKSRIFNKFSQASQSQEKKGTGLGLSISKAIIEELGGSIDFEPRSPNGTTFYFTLPSL